MLIVFTICVFTMLLQKGESNQEVREQVEVGALPTRERFFCRVSLLWNTNYSTQDSYCSRDVVRKELSDTLLRQAEDN